MKLGTFSISLKVKDIAQSKAFYEGLGFEIFAGVEDQSWLILRNGAATIGLFQGMLEENVMTFNPGWDQNAQPVADFTDVRQVQAHLKASGAELVSEAEPDGSGPANFMARDPDGNLLLFDQHV